MKDITVSPGFQSRSK